MIALDIARDIPMRVGERFTLPTVPAPWCNFVYEVTRRRGETVSLKVVEKLP